MNEEIKEITRLQDKLFNEIEKTLKEGSSKVVVMEGSNEVIIENFKGNLVNIDWNWGHYKLYVFYNEQRASYEIPKTHSLYKLIEDLINKSQIERKLNTLKSILGEDA